MMRAWRRAFLLGIVALIQVDAVDAQRSGRGGLLDPPRVGPHLGYNFDADALTVGVQATLPVTSRVELYPSFDYYAVNLGTLWALNVDMKFRPPSRTGAAYVGGGIDYLHNSAGGGRDVLLNFIGGFEARRRPFVPYVEGRLILGGGSIFQIVGGFNFNLQ